MMMMMMMMIIIIIQLTKRKKLFLTDLFQESQRFSLYTDVPLPSEKKFG